MKITLRVAVGLLSTLFFLWGVANNLNDILIQQFKTAFDLSDLEAGLVQSVFYSGYFLMAIPAALFMKRFSYQAAIVLGLALFGAGALLFLPAAEMLDYRYFLGVLFIVAIGLALLETAANPFMAGLGARQEAARRLNLAQSFNPLGSMTGILIGRQFIFSKDHASAADLAAMTAPARAVYREAAARAVQGPYLLIGLVVLAWAILFAVIRFPAIVTDARDEQEASGSGFAIAVRQPHLLWSVAAQFFYVGAQVGIWSYIIRYALVAMPDLGNRGASDYLIASLALFMIGRFAGTAAMKYVEPVRLMAVYAVINAVLLGTAVSFHGSLGLICLVASSFFMSIMYPTIFATGIAGLGSATKAGASFIVMAIIGGAVITAIMGRVSDLAGINFAFAVPLLCFVFIALYCRIIDRQPRRGSISATVPGH